MRTTLIFCFLLTVGLCVSEADSTQTRKHIRLSKPLAEYAAASGKSDRALKNLIRHGKKQNNPVPFDDLPRMRDWWVACMKHAPPAWLDAWIATSNPPVPGPIERDFSQVKGLSIEENVEGARKMHAINNLLLEEAHRSGNANLVQQRLSSYDKSLNTLRTAELNLIQVQEARGSLIDKETVTAETAQLMEILKLQREQMPTNIIKDLARSRNRPLRRILRVIQPHLLASINTVRAQEDIIFRKLDTVDSTQTVLDILEK